MKTDSELRRDVERELEWDPSSDARNIAVAVKNGVVTLIGHVPTYSDKWRAENIAKRVAGVTAIANEIEVKLTDERTDADIAESARMALKLDSRVPAESVKVVVSKGWVTLEGKVPYYYQKSTAESDVRYLAGVRSHERDRGRVHCIADRHQSQDRRRVETKRPPRCESNLGRGPKRQGDSNRNRTLVG
jgi:osmotically-inducible protein OsmY